MKRFLILFPLCLGAAAFAQDEIITRSGEVIEGKVQEITQTEIRYKKSSNPDGPVYTLNKSDVSVIEYKNGTKDVFTAKQAQSSQDDVVAANTSSGASSSAASSTPPSSTQVNNYYGSPAPRPNVNLVLGMGVGAPYWGWGWYNRPWGWGGGYYRPYYGWGHHYYGHYHHRR